MLYRVKSFFPTVEYFLWRYLVRKKKQTKQKGRIYKQWAYTQGLYSIGRKEKPTGGRPDDDLRPDTRENRAHPLQYTYFFLFVRSSKWCLLHDPVSQNYTATTLKATGYLKTAATNIERGGDFLCRSLRSVKFVGKSIPLSTGLSRIVGFKSIPWH